MACLPLGETRVLVAYVSSLFYAPFFSTPWLHLSNLCTACGFPGKKLYEGLFAVSFLIVRVVLGTIVAVQFITDLSTAVVQRTAHSDTAVVLAMLSCAVICSLQLYWGAFVVAEMWRVLCGRGKAKKQ